MKKLLLLMCLLLFPVQAWAAGCDCGSITAIVTRAKLETVELVNAFTAAEAMTIRAETGHSGRADLRRRPSDP